MSFTLATHSYTLETDVMLWDVYEPRDTDQWRQLTANDLRLGRQGQANGKQKQMSQGRGKNGGESSWGYKKTGGTPKQSMGEHWEKMKWNMEGFLKSWSDRNWRRQIIRREERGKWREVEWWMQAGDQQLSANISMHPSRHHTVLPSASLPHTQKHTQGRVMWNH